MHHVTLSFSRKSCASVGFDILSLTLNFVVDCFIIYYLLESVAAFHFFFRCENQFICKIECRGLWVMNANVSAKKLNLYRMTIFMKYATVAGNMTRSGKDITHTWDHEIQERKVPTTIAMTPLKCCLFWMLHECDYVKRVNFSQELHSNFEHSLNWTTLKLWRWMEKWRK